MTEEENKLFDMMQLAEEMSFQNWKTFKVLYNEKFREAQDRIRDLEHALEFIRKKASSPKIWYAGVAQAALDGEVKAPEKKT